MIHGPQRLARAYAGGANQQRYSGVSRSGARVRVGLLLLIGFQAAISHAAETADAVAPESMQLSGGEIRLELTSPDLFPARDRLRRWVVRSADTVARYYGQFPMGQAHVLLIPDAGAGIAHGVAFRRETGIINVSVGTSVTDGALREDWVLVHEMIHLALPNIRRQHLWLSEGLSTYVEGVARVQAGHRTAADVWRELMRAMPQGLPRAGDRGLDHTHTWGRTYWGGALFCLLADIGIREHSRLRQGLQDAMAAVAAASRGDSSLWPIERVLRIGDGATGTTVLTDLYAEMKDQPASPDLDALWAGLGVVGTGASVRLDDTAPHAAIRRLIMSPPAAAAH